MAAGEPLTGKHFALRLLGVVLAVAALLTYLRDVLADGWRPAAAAWAAVEVLLFGAVALLGVLLERRDARPAQSSAS